MRKYCVRYLYGELWVFLLFSSSQGQSSWPSPWLITTALWDFPVSTDTPSTQIPKQFVPIGLMRSFLWSGPPRLGLAEVPRPTSCHHAAHPPTLLVRSLLGASATSPAEGLAPLPTAPPGLFVL